MANPEIELIYQSNGLIELQAVSQGLLSPLYLYINNQEKIPPIETLTSQEKLHYSLGAELADRISLGIPEFTGPFLYSREDAVETEIMFKQLTNYAYDDLSYQSPFESVVSLRHIKRLSGLSTKEIKRVLKKPFHFGELTVQFGIRRQREQNTIKKASHSSATENGEIHPADITYHKDRILNNRIMIGVRDLYVNDPS